jgi:hypothetical protein
MTVKIAQVGGKQVGGTGRGVYSCTGVQLTFRLINGTGAFCPA